MTEEIIINGVDVSGCLHYKDKQCIITHFINGNRSFEDKCELAPICYYKQLQRKTKECKNNEIAYINDLEILNQACADLKNELDDMTMECEKFKSKLKIATEALKSIACTSEWDCESCEGKAGTAKDTLEQIGEENVR